MSLFTSVCFTLFCCDFAFSTYFLKLDPLEVEGFGQRLDTFLWIFLQIVKLVSRENVPIPNLGSGISE